MVALVLALTVAVSGVLEVTIAPDQPFPQVYVGEPLVVEYVSSEDGMVMGELELVSAGGTETLPLPPVEVRAGRPHWLRLDDVALERGAYTATFRLGDEEIRGAFCRVDRPREVVPLPVTVLLGGGVLPPYPLLDALPTKRMTIYAGTQTTAQSAARLRERSFEVELFFQSPPPETYTALETEAAAWLVPASDTEALGRLVEPRRANAGGAEIVPALHSPRDFERLLDAGIGARLRTVVIYSQDAYSYAVRTYRLAAQRAGIEGLRFEYAIPPEQGGLLAAELLGSWAEGYAAARVSVGQVFQGGTPQGGFAVLSGLAQRLRSPRYVGPVDAPGRVRAEVYLPQGGPSDGWVLAVWGGEGEACGFLVGEAEELALTDALNNPLGTPALEEGVVTLEAGPEARLLSGRGGVLIERAARRRFEGLVEALPGLEGAGTVAREEVLTAIQAIHEELDTADPRYAFFTVIRALPQIEAAWHRGEHPRARAVPVMAALGRIARVMCILEEERGEAFLEPLHETLARCAEFQSLYLTGTGSTRGAQERADWIMDEVSRLMAEARSLSENGRGIEADAVAALAEWRARALQYAADAAPLSQPDPYVAKEPVEESEE